MENAIFDAIKIKYLNDENAKFYKKGDFIGIKLIVKDENGNQTEEDKGMVTLRRLFPFDEKTTMITVLDHHDEEIGIIEDAAALEESSLLLSELEKVYFMPKIISIISMKERFGYSNWKVKTDKGVLEFALNDVYKSMIKLGSRIIIGDMDGGRYEIEDVSLLDKSSYRKIELYL